MTASKGCDLLVRNFNLNLKNRAVRENDFFRDRLGLLALLALECGQLSVRVRRETSVTANIPSRFSPGVPILTFSIAVFISVIDTRKLRLINLIIVAWRNITPVCSRRA